MCALKHCAGGSMTREQVAKKIHWEAIIWAAGLVNVFAMTPQLFKLLTTHETAGISVGMFVIYGMIQIAFCLEGYFKRNRMLFVCLGLSAIVSALIIGLILYFRSQGN
jgi:uncharacterized protein with PQ loop repeat